MAWSKPKTDWKPTDYVVTSTENAYNRIIGNISFLKALADEPFANLTEVDMGEEKTYLSMIYAREMNDIENALETLNLETYGFDIGEKQTFRANGSTPLWSEFNRIESAILLLYNTMMAHKEALPRLSFTLGSQKGIKV